MTQASFTKARRGNAVTWVAVTWVAAGLTVLALAVVHLQLYRVIENTGNAAYPQYVARNFTAASVLLVAFLAPALISRLRVSVPRWGWIAAGAVSLFAALAPMAIHGLGWAEPAALIYQGQRVPQAGAIFVDLNVVLKSIWCSGLGFDVYQAGNGCIDPVIYGPGVLWAGVIPLDLRSTTLLAWSGVIIAILASLALGLIARASRGIGVLAVAICALGAPWLLMLERGNLDALVIVVGVGVAYWATKRNDLAGWWLAATAIWLCGTWKYYPFAMGLALIPALRVRRGWTVLVGFGAATAAFLLLTWETFRASTFGYEGLVSLDDYIVVGRIPVVARMVDATFPPDGYQLGDAVILAMAVAAAAWGALVARGMRMPSMRAPMLSVMGAVLFLASVLVAGFGWAYKSTFLILCLPLLSLPIASVNRSRSYAALATVLCAVVGALVVWNTVLATLAGILAASFAAGASLVLLFRYVWPRTTGSHPAPATTL